jgi:hypothetical protein
MPHIPIEFVISSDSFKVRKSPLTEVLPVLNIRLFFLAIIVSATSLAMEEAKLFESFHEGSIAEIKDPKIVLTLKGEELKTYLNQLKSCNLRYERYFRRAAKLMSALKEEDQKIYGEFRDNIIGQLENGMWKQAGNGRTGCFR